MVVVTSCMHTEAGHNHFNNVTVTVVTIVGRMSSTGQCHTIHSASRRGPIHAPPPTCNNRESLGTGEFDVPACRVTKMSFELMNTNSQWIKHTKTITSH